MEPMVEASVVTAAGFLLAALIKLLPGKKKVDKVRVGDVVGSNVAVGDNIVQTQTGDFHNHLHLTLPLEKLEKVPSVPRYRDIMDAIEAAKPFDKNVIAGNYTGLEICWPVKFNSIRPVGDEKNCDLCFEDAEVPASIILVTVSINDYPKLKVIDVGHEAWLEGRIECARRHSLELENGAKIALR